MTDPTSLLVFPLPLEAYAHPSGEGLAQILAARVQADPFNLVATIIFFLAILHTFMASRIQHLAHVVEGRHAERLQQRESPSAEDDDNLPEEVSFAGQLLHFFGEIEAIFGIWAVVLGGAIVWFKGVDTATHYLAEKVDYTEPMFVVIAMTIAATRPVLELAERLLSAIAGLGHGKPVAWWLAILIIAPLLGSFITEPAAMTIAALLLARQFYALHPSPRLKYATIGLLFVNVSVGGTLTHFAAPPVLMVATSWGWDLAFMAGNFGWRAGLGILLSTLLYLLLFRKELLALHSDLESKRGKGARREPIPGWVTLVHLGFMGFAVWAAHYPVLLVGGFLFFIAFTEATAHHQTKIDLRPALLVGFFLAGLVIHGGLQGWWLAPVLSRLNEGALFWGATALTAFNDNAAITYLATLVPGFSDSLKYAVVAGAVTGGGLTVIANAPNPAGQAILRRYFPDGVSPGGLFLAALPPTLLMALCFLL
ncbi:MAG TPA: putative Na+/H+ antiporter [Rectinemataceae bacterium]|nr:putative Na+/H+ antiporter [Rectinemataceae bacterium]